MAEEKIFSGKASEELWSNINSIEEPILYWPHKALYLMGCKAQELEAYTMGLEKRIELLENQMRLNVEDI